MKIMLYALGSIWFAFCWLMLLLIFGYQGGTGDLELTAVFLGCVVSGIIFYFAHRRKR